MQHSQIGVKRSRKKTNLKFNLVGKNNSKEIKTTKKMSKNKIKSLGNDTASHFLFATLLLSSGHVDVFFCSK